MFHLCQHMKIHLNNKASRIYPQLEPRATSYTGPMVFSYTPAVTVTDSITFTF